jgi:hypothetical protein
MEIDELLDSILATDDRIMAVSIADGKYNYLGHKVRKRVALFIPKGEAFENLLLSPTLLLGAAERWEPLFGRISRISLRMERAVFYLLKIYIIAIVLPPATESAVLDRVGEALKRLAD